MSARAWARTDHHESVVAELEWLRGAPRAVGRRPLESIGSAAGGVPFLVQEFARDVEDRFDVEIAFALPQLMEVDVLGMTEQPRGLVIERVRSFLQLSNAQRDAETLALNAETAARRSVGQRRRSERAPFDGGCHGLLS